MKKNVGTLDRALRILLGLGLVGWGIYAQNPWGAIGLVGVATGLAARCPAYAPFGIRTCPASY